MNRPGIGVKAILVLIFICAVWVRLASLGTPVYPYYKGDSGTNFRETRQIIENGTLPAVDRSAAWPNGYSPSRVGPTGIEYFTAFAFRLVRPFTDTPEQRFVRLITILFFSLSVFTFYGLTSRLWTCQSAGVFSAMLVAFSGPLIDFTNGKEFLPEQYAVVLVSLHLAVLLDYLRKPSVLGAVLSGLLGLALLAVWASAGIYVVAVVTLCVLSSRLDQTAKSRIIVAHLAVLVVGGVLLPHLRAQRFVFSWATLWVLSSTAYTYRGRILPHRIPGIIYIAAGTAILTLLCKPLQSGGIEVLSPLEYWYYRIRYLTGKPDDPGALPDAIRTVWTLGRTYAHGYLVFVFYFPLIFAAVATPGAFREFRKEQRGSIWAPILLALVGTALFIIDRRAIVLAALFVFPTVSVVFYAFRRHIKSRISPIGIAALLLVTNAVLPFGKANATFRIAERLGLSPVRSGGFDWVSLGNADRDLVRFVVSRTSVRNDVFLTVPEISPLVTTFSGRAAVLAPGVTTSEMADRVTDAMGRFYGGETDFHAICEALGVTYVLYSIDFLLDTSKYSPRYTAGFKEVDEEAVVNDMHFAPEKLRHFQLVYENDNYRLFRVTEKTEPFFITDHPPVYQASILRSHDDDLESFYERIVDILLTYQTGVEFQIEGDEQGAIRRFRYCLDQAPFFTKAWLGVGDSLHRLGDYEASFAAYNRVLGYSPDNKHALYYGALALAYLGRNEEGLSLLEILLASTADRETRSRAQELQRVLLSGQPLERPQRQ
ncbi:MAG: tetratricopeptide repeat protein [Candidatus Latescibacterota bacterium]|nr:MAG: tetratricopeptide repeat protein [Candidatus Latescibacterota bacterium]